MAPTRLAASKPQRKVKVRGLAIFLGVGRWPMAQPGVSIEGPVSWAERPRPGPPRLVTWGMESRRGCLVRWSIEWALEPYWVSVSLDNQLNLSVPQFSPLENGYHNHYFMESGLNELISRKHLAQCLSRGKHLEDISYFLTRQNSAQDKTLLLLQFLSQLPFLGFPSCFTNFQSFQAA